MSKKTLLFNFTTAIVFGLMQGCQPLEMQQTNDQTSEPTKKTTNNQTSEQTKKPTNDQSSEPIKAKEAKPSEQLEKRCGWLKNPTPGNIWLEDRDQEWTIGIQGRYQAESEQDWWPNFSSDEWVKFNGNYGYGCACLDFVTEKETGKILKIQSGEAKSLAACKNDPQLDAAPFSEAQ